jgi:hypothetical protein
VLKLGFRFRRQRIPSKVFLTCAMPPSFTRDFTTGFCQRWALWLEKFAGRANVHGIEVGCLEGKSSLWFLENILQHESSHLTCIDPKCAPSFSENIRQYRHKVRLMQETAEVALRNPPFALNSIDFVYIDASTNAHQVLQTAVLVFPFLAEGGILIFNCYLWKSQTPHIPQTMPKLAVDGFLLVFAASLRLRHQGFQLAIEKTVETMWN